MRRIKILKHHLLNVSDQLKSNSKEIGIFEMYTIATGVTLLISVVQLVDTGKWTRKHGDIYIYT